MKKRIITFDRFVRLLISVILILLAYVLIRRLSNVLLPFLAAWLVAYMLYPIVCFFQYRCRLRSRTLSIIVTLVLILTILIGGTALILPPIIDELNQMRHIITNYLTTDTTVTTVSAEIEQFIKHNIDINQITHTFTLKDISLFLEEKIPHLIALISSSLSAIIGFICSLISIIYLFFILADYEAMADGFFRLAPPSKRRYLQTIMADLKNGMNAYFRGQTIIALCVGILFAIGFLLIDFPLAIPLGLFIGLLNLVPYLQVIGFIPTIILAILKAHDTGSSFWSIILAALAVFAIVQAIQDWVLTPRIMGKVTGLNAAIILLALSIWGSLLGFIGLIIALPLTTILFSYYKRYVLHEPPSTDTDQQEKQPHPTTPSASTSTPHNHTEHRSSSEKAPQP